MQPSIKTESGIFPTAEWDVNSSDEKLIQIKQMNMSAFICYLAHVWTESSSHWG